MSNSYEVLIDTSATPENALERAALLRSALLSTEIISTETSTRSVLNGVGYLPGPKLPNMYRFTQGSLERPAELNYWQDLMVNGVEIIQERWVNFFGFTVFQWSRCPECKTQFDDGHSVIDSLVDASANFYNSDGSYQVQCPACKKSFDVRRWKTKPHLGHCYVAAVFWNWPSFDSPGWQISIPEVVSQAMGVPLENGFGRI